MDEANENIDTWFYKINNSINPLYQTFDGIQDRNRFLVPYSFLKVYLYPTLTYSLTDC